MEFLNTDKDLTVVNTKVYSSCSKRKSQTLPPADDDSRSLVDRLVASIFLLRLNASLSQDAHHPGCEAPCNTPDLCTFNSRPSESIYTALESSESKTTYLATKIKICNQGHSGFNYTRLQCTNSSPKPCSVSPCAAHVEKHTQKPVTG